MTNELVVSSAGNELAVMPVMDIALAIQRRDQIIKFTKSIMVTGTDFGIIPGTDKPTLLKPGAEKLTTFFGLSKRFEIIERVEDWTGKDHGGEPFFYYLYRCSLHRGTLLIAEADGSCSSFEAKYRWRKSERVCPSCGQANIRKSKQGGGWYCWQKTGGCGATFKAGDVSIESQEVGRIPNPDVADQVNTVQKMAQKRALVAATLLAVNASEFFTQDLEDYVDGDFVANGTAHTEPPAPPPAPPEPAKPNGNSGDVPNSPAALLDVVNRRVLAQFDNINHLYNAIKGDAPDWAGWPKSTDKAAWQQVYNLAMAHAKAKEQPEQPAAPVEDELPF